MSQYLHHVSGIFANRMEAKITLDKIIDQGLPRERTNIFESSVELPATTQQAKSNATLKNMVVDGTIGAAVGTSVGALAEMAFVLENVSLFIVSPMLAPFALLGLGAGLGGIMGATIGAGPMAEHKVQSPKKAGWFSDLIKDAISNGQVVLVIKTISIDETKKVKKVIKAAVANYTDVNAA